MLITKMVKTKNFENTHTYTHIIYKVNKKKGWKKVIPTKIKLSTLKIPVLF